MPRDYYKILGVSEKADKDEIKKKYRDLAKKYHPDRNKGDKAAEEKFKEISEAYQVLKDDQKRQQYDNMRRFGGFAGAGRPGAGGFPGGGGTRFYTNADFSQVFGDRFDINDLFGMGGLGDIFSSMFGDNVRARRRSPFGRQQAGPRKGQSIRAELNITADQAASGTSKKIRLGVPDSCAACKGQGTVPGSGETTCPRCNGAGQVTSVQGNFSVSRPCPACLGRGVRPGQTCGVCNGSGTVKKKKTVRVRIPAGINNGETIRLCGLGCPGTGGGPKGDLIIKVNVMGEQKYSRDDKDIHTTVDITFPQAALGAKVPVQALTKKVNVNIKPGTQPGTILRLKGLGLGGGDLKVRINVVVPTNLTDRQKELLKEFESASVAA